MCGYTDWLSIILFIFIVFFLFLSLIVIGCHLFYFVLVF